MSNTPLLIDRTSSSFSSEPRIKNVYRLGLPVEKAVPVGSTVVLKPILPRDFVTGIELVGSSKKEARAALLFHIVNVGPDVKHSIIAAGNYCVVSEASLDFADPDGTHVIADEQDIKLVFTEESLQLC